MKIAQKEREDILLLHEAVVIRDLAAKRDSLLLFPHVNSALKERFWADLWRRVDGDAVKEVVLLSLLAIGEASRVLTEASLAQQEEIFRKLAAVEKFYESIGGIIGYHLKALELLDRAPREALNHQYMRPPCIDVREKNRTVRRYTLFGLLALPKMGELYPLGGLGDRLQFKSLLNDPLPVALLPFCGRSLLEGLIRDVQAREYLYYKLFGLSLVTPIALMSSFENRGDALIFAHFEERQWFGRPKESFFLFSQISVPVITEEGTFSMRKMGEVAMQPGGHGALWRTAEQKGVFEWFHKQGRSALLVRQINNPLGGVDHGLLALAGVGVHEEKTFGFASCKRLSHAAEGVLLLREETKEKKRAIVNIEYTDFERYNIEDTSDEEGYSPFPTNTNILFVNLPHFLPHIDKQPIPSLILNMKSNVTQLTESGDVKLVKGGRLESMMQNISDTLVADTEEELPTFITYNDRLKTISTAKKSFEEGKSLLETPQGAFYDLMRGNCRLLEECGFTLPPFCTVKNYLRGSVSTLFEYHPALGPLYEVIVQKLCTGVLHKGSELVLEIAQVSIENLHLKGSLRITAEQITMGTCHLKNVTIQNRGIKRTGGHLFWKGEINRHESLDIEIGGSGEFFAENVTFTGGQKITVATNERCVALQQGHEVIFQRTPITHPTWHWEYTLLREEIKLVRRAVNLTKTPS